MPHPPRPLLDFLVLFARGEYWESHEVLEGPWREDGSAFYQGLILYASAWVHFERRNAHGVQAQLGKTLARLADYPDAWLGIDVEAVRRHCREVRSVVASSPDWYEVTGPLDLVLDPARIRGDEPELGRVDRGESGGDTQTDG